MWLTSTWATISAQPSIFRAVDRTTMAPGAAWSVLRAAVDARRHIDGSDRAVFLVDEFFPLETIASWVGAGDGDVWVSVSTEHEPYTDGIDDLMSRLESEISGSPCAVIGIGGGITMDTAKAVSNLYGNPGIAESFQGWDLLRSPGVYKIGVPTISGTGAEASRTCVMTNATTGLKLGMNSQFTFFDEVILDSSLTGTVPRDQYFFTGMDTYMHGFESLHGSHRNHLSDALSRESLRLVREVFSSGDAKSDLNREKLMTASFLGGTAIAGTYVGLVHPVSAGLSVVFGTRHGVGNCIAMRAMQEFYPVEYEEFWGFAEAQGVEVPKLGGMSWDSDTLGRLAAATLLHEKPLSNALGPDYRDLLTPAKMRDMFRQL